MENQPLITVIVPVYKVEAYLSRCVDSILGQTYDNLEVILVDDGSPDGCPAICDDYARRDSRVKVIHQPNGGLSQARNSGLDIARGEYIAFVDSDDWIQPDTYEAMLSLLQKEQVLLVCAGRYNVEESTGEKTPGLCPAARETISGEELVKRIFTWDHVDTSSWDKLYHRSLWEGIRFPVGMVNEDFPTIYRLVLRAGRAALLDQPVYNYLQRKGSITSSSVSEKLFHYPQNTELVYRDIAENHPALEPYARYLRLSARGYALIRLDMDPVGKKTFAREYAQLKKSLRKDLPFILTSPLVGRRNRRLWLLEALGLYAVAYRLRSR